MTIELKRKGTYETFKTTKNHKILVLDNNDYYAWVSTSQGNLLVLTDSDHEKLESINNGDYVLLTPQNEPDWKDNVDHLEMKENGKYRTYMLPNGLPQGDDKQKKIIETEDYLSDEKISRILKNG